MTPSEATTPAATRTWSASSTSAHWTGRHYYAVYSALFILFSIASFGYVALSGKTFIWSPDGWHQHFKALVYYSEYLREIVRHLAFDHQLVVPEWDFTLSEGSDIVATLNYYVFGDPLALLSVFVPARSMHIFFGFLCILRLYLAGISFSMLCFGTGCPRPCAVLCGSLSYSFCMWGILCSVRHPFFVNPMIYFPLMILGVEKVIREKRPFLFVVATAISAASNFYFFYMIVVLTTAYALVRLVMLYKGDAAAFLRTLARLFFFALVGACIAGVILLPTFMQFAEDARLGTPIPFTLFYPLTYYSALPAALSSSVLIGKTHWFLGSFTVPVLLAVPLLFTGKHQEALLKALFVVCALLVLFPLGGRILNGMSYASNRWSWAFALLCCSVLVFKWDSLTSLCPRNRLTLARFSSVYLALCFLLDDSRTTAAFVSLGIMLATILVLPSKSAQDHFRRGEVILLVAALACVANASFWLFTPQGDNHLDELISSNDIIDKLTDNEAHLISERTRDAYPRYTGHVVTRNANFLEGVSNTQYYWSLTNPTVTRWRSDLSILEERSFDFVDYDDRTALTTLASVQYFIANGSEAEAIPFGFEKTDIAQGEDYSIYQNANALPLGYCYDSYLTTETWDSLDAVQKQEAQLVAAFVDKPPTDIAPAGYRAETYNIGFTIESQSDNAFPFEHGFMATSSDARVTLVLPAAQEGCETYISVEGLRFASWPEFDLYFGEDDMDSSGEYGEESWGALSVGSKYAILREKIGWDPVQNARIAFSSDIGTSKTINYLHPASQSSVGRSDFVVNLGYSESPVSEITIALPQRGTYTFDSLKVYRVPFGDFAQKVEMLKESTLQHLAIETNRLSGDIDLPTAKILCLAIPYSSGWCSYIDGKEKETLCVNQHYVGVAVPQGEHEIEIRYHSPYKREGGILSCIGVTAFLGIAVFRRSQKKTGGAHVGKRPNEVQEDVA